MINYSLSQKRKDPQNPDSEKLYYARMQSSGSVTLDDIASDIAYATSLTDSDVLATIRAFIHQLNKHLAEGKIVKADNFGSFQLQIHSKGAATKKEFSPGHITGVSIQFRPGNMVQSATTRAVGGLTFKRVPTKKELAEGVTDDTETPVNPDEGGGGPMD